MYKTKVSPEEKIKAAEAAGLCRGQADALTTAQWKELGYFEA